MRYLWTNRMGYLRGMGNKKRGCIFCNIAEGKDKENMVIYKDDKVCVIMNRYPYNTGHILIAPLKHYKTIEEMPTQEYEWLCEIMRRSLRVLKAALSPLGFNIGLHIGGEIVGATFEHVHFHVVPRFRRDLGFMETTANTKVMPQSLEDTYKEIMAHASLFKEQV